MNKAGIAHDWVTYVPIDFFVGRGA